MYNTFIWVLQIYCLSVNVTTALHCRFYEWNYWLLLHLFIGYEYLLGKFWKHEEVLWQIIIQLILKGNKSEYKLYIKTHHYLSTMISKFFLLLTWNETFQLMKSTNHRTKNEEPFEGSNPLRNNRKGERTPKIMTSLQFSQIEKHW